LVSKERERLRRKGELKRYLQAELNLDGYYGEPLRWQEIGNKEYPKLAGLAFTVFAIPAMSAECERAFIRAGKMVTNNRYQLKADIIEADQLIKCWLAGGLIDRNKAWQDPMRYSNNTSLRVTNNDQSVHSHQQEPPNVLASLYNLNQHHCVRITTVLAVKVSSRLPIDQAPRSHRSRLHSIPSFINRASRGALKHLDRLIVETTDGEHANVFEVQEIAARKTLEEAVAGQRGL